ncbi:MAG: right-handed parallel beta-helix repeat-containing protein, partial [Gammaproteobacteria bacterium]
LRETAEPYALPGVLSIDGASGTAIQPITLRAAPGETPHIKGPGGAWSQIRFRNCRHWVVDGLEISNISRSFRIDNSSEITIHNMHMHDSVQAHISIVGGSHDILVENNTIENGGFIPDDSGKYHNGEGLYLGHNAGGDLIFDVVIRGNTISRMQADCIDLKPDVHDVVIEGNTFEGCMLNERCMASNNWVTCFGNEGISVRETVEYRQNPNHLIRNKVFKNQSSDVGGGVVISLLSGADVYNNIVYGVSSDEIAIKIGPQNPHRTRVIHNTLDIPPARAVVNASRGDVRNNIGPNEPGNLPASAAAFANASSGDYHLASALPGTTVQDEFGRDFAGRERGVDGVWDLGAFEFEAK